MDWSIQDIARMAGTTSRTLRHYDDVGLLAPSRIGGNGYRYYDQAALIRLQRVLLLRELGLCLKSIAEVLDHETDTKRALRSHLSWLRAEQVRIGEQLASVQTTLNKLEGGEQLMATEMFDGFDHTQYKEEVEQRWGKKAYAAGDRWWRSLTEEQKRQYQQQHVDIAADYGKARQAGLAVDSDEVQSIVQRHFDWLNSGAQANGLPMSRSYFNGLGQMYVADSRFAANYGGLEGAEYVRDAMQVYGERQLRDARDPS